MSRCVFVSYAMIHHFCESQSQGPSVLMFVVDPFSYQVSMYDAGLSRCYLIQR